MHYPLAESIGDPDLLVGREQEFNRLNQWRDYIPRRLGKSQVILARRKSGKTALVQRFFNQLWSENGKVIPFYVDFKDANIWFPHLAIEYYRAFASQYLSFLGREPQWVNMPLSLEELKAIGVANGIDPLRRDIEFLLQNRDVGGNHDLMWQTACSAPHRFACFFDQRLVVILDEFQNLTQHVYREENCKGEPDKTLAGSYHALAESKFAPLLVTGSYVGWLMEVIAKHLQAGRLEHFHVSPYLTPEEGLQAVFKYADVFQQPLTNETAVQLNELCFADPFFISCIIKSQVAGKDLTTTAGVIDAVNYEVANRQSQMSGTWEEYLQRTLQRINDRHAKMLLLHLSKQADRYWTPRELKEVLHLDLEIDEIQRKLVLLSKADLIDRGSSDIDFRGLQDGTLNLIIRHRFEKEINQFVPNLKQEFHEKIAHLTTENRKLRGMLNHLSGKLAEHQLANALRGRRKVKLADFFPGAPPLAPCTFILVRERVVLQREDGKVFELDVVADSEDDRVLVVEVKKLQVKTGLALVEIFAEKVAVYQQQFPAKVVLAGFLSLGSFTEEARAFCQARGIVIAERVECF
jgi:hypothetical protein